MPTRARSLADDLRARDESALVTLLQRRPDLARPAPADLTTLAARATTRSSVHQALDRLTLAHLQVLEAVVVGAPASAAQIAALLGKGSRSARVKELTDDLIGLALCWRSPEGIRPARTVAEVIGDPAGLGPPSPDLDAAQVQTALGRVTSGHRAVLEALQWGPAVATLPVAGQSGVARATQDLLRWKLLRPLDEDRVVLPRQVGLALRGGVLYQEAALQPPPAGGRPVSAADVDAAAGARAADLISQVSEVVEVWERRPPRVLRSGGLAVRDLGSLASHLERDTTSTAWLLEVMLAAGLLGSDGADAHWVPSTAVDDWLQDDPGTQWAELAAAWWRMPAAPSLVGSSGQGSGRVNALSLHTSWPAGRRRRQDLLRVLAADPQPRAADPEHLQEALRWHHPMRASAVTDADLAVVLREGEWAGVLGRGAVSSAGRVLVCADGADGASAAGTNAETIAAAAAAMREWVPAAVESVLLQADLTAVAVGRLHGHIRTVLGLTADLESRGGATVHRFTESSVRRALDAGWDVERTVAELDSISATGVPQPLRYLIGDVARRHGAIRLGAANTYLRSDDPALLDAIAADRGLALLTWQRLSENVLVSPVDPATALDLLREHRYAPVADAASALPATVLNPQRRRTSVRAPSPVHTSTVDEASARRVVTAMRTVEAERPAALAASPVEGTDPAVSAERARVAAETGTAIWVGLADDAGRIQRLLFWPRHVEAGRVHGHLEGESRQRTLALHRITGVVPAT